MNRAPTIPIAPAKAESPNPVGASLLAKRLVSQPHIQRLPSRLREQARSYRKAVSLRAAEACHD